MPSSWDRGSTWYSTTENTGAAITLVLIYKGGGSIMEEVSQKIQKDLKLSLPFHLLLSSWSRVSPREKHAIIPIITQLWSPNSEILPGEASHKTAIKFLPKGTDFSFLTEHREVQSLGCSQKKVGVVVKGNRKMCRFNEETGFNQLVCRRLPGKETA